MPLRFHCVLLRRIACLGLLLGLASQGAWGQSSSNGVTLSVRGAPLEEGLLSLLRQTDAQLLYESSLVAERRTSCTVTEASVEEALRCLLRATGLDFYRTSSGLYVITEVAEAPPAFGTLHGLVVDRDTGAPLANAHVMLRDGRGAVTNESGRFTLPRLKSGAYALTTSFIGYRPHVDSVWVAAEGTVNRRIALQPELYEVSSSVVVNDFYTRLPSEDLGSGEVSQEEFLNAPQGASANILDGLNQIPSVYVNDATAEIHVQGGESGEHSLRLDGAPVFVPISLGSVIGPFSPFAIERLTVYKAGFGAEMGSQLSGAIQAEHTLGGTTPRALDVQLDPMSLNGRVQLKLDGAREIHLMTAARVGLWDLYAYQPVQRLLNDWNTTDPFLLAAFYEGPLNDSLLADSFRVDAGNPSLGFFDAHAAARIRLSPTRSLEASGYWGRRHLESDREPFLAFGPATEAALDLYRDFYTWQNGTGQVHYEAVLGRRVLAGLRLRGSHYRLSHAYALGAPSVQNPVASCAGSNPLCADDGNRVTEIGAEARIDYYAGNNTLLYLGLDPAFTDNSFSIHGISAQQIRHAASSWRLGSFASLRLPLGPWLVMQAGSRLTYLSSHQQVYAEPRLSLRLDRKGDWLGPWSARVAAGLYRQFLSRFDVSSRSPRALVSANRVWLAVDASVAPPKAWHLTGELLLHPASTWTLRVEGYYKAQPHLLAINYAAVPFGSGPAEKQQVQEAVQRDFLTEGKGLAYGGAVTVEKTLPRTLLRARYDYSFAEREIDQLFQIIQGEPPPAIQAPWNEPHRAELAVDWKPRARWALVGRWRAVWERPWAFRKAYYDLLGAYWASRTEIWPDEIIENLKRNIRRYELDTPGNASNRLDLLSQLDLSAAYARPVGGAHLQVRLDLLNVLDRDNAADWRLVFDPETFDSEGVLKREERLLLPFTPSLAIRLRW